MSIANNSYGMSSFPFMTPLRVGSHILLDSTPFIVTIHSIITTKAIMQEQHVLKSSAEVSFCGFVPLAYESSTSIDFIFNM